MIRSARIAPGARRVHELRIQLPASCAESGNAVDVFWRQRKGPWQAERLPGLEAAASRFRPRRLSACLHPADLASASLPMPPLARPLLLKAARQLEGGKVVAFFIEYDQADTGGQCRVDAAAFGGEQLLPAFAATGLRFDLDHAGRHFRRQPFQILAAAGADPVGLAVADSDDGKFHCAGSRQIPDS